MKLTHLDENGAAHMVNIGAKPVTQREAVAQSVLTMQPETLRMILDGTVPKGDVFACARIAGIMAADRERGHRHWGCLGDAGARCQHAALFAQDRH